MTRPLLGSSTRAASASFPLSPRKTMQWSYPPGVVPFLVSAMRAPISWASVKSIAVPLTGASFPVGAAKREFYGEVVSSHSLFFLPNGPVEALAAAVEMIGPVIGRQRIHFTFE